MIRVDNQKAPTCKTADLRETNTFAAVFLDHQHQGSLQREQH